MVSRNEPTKRDGEEARLEPRRRMLKACQILSLDRKATSAIDCTLRNMSSSGAQLSGPATSLSRIPSEFYLVAPGQLRMIQSKVVWKSYDTVGIKFLSDPGNLASGQAEALSEPNATLTPPENYVLDRTTGAVVRLEDLESGKAPSPVVQPSGKASEFGELERTVSAALGLKVEIAGAGEPGGRVVVHVQTLEQLYDVCRKLAQT